MILSLSMSAFDAAAVEAVVTLSAVKAGCTVTISAHLTALEKAAANAK